MREIKFRGYNAKNKEWLYGCYLINRGEHFICPDGIQPPDKTPEDYQVIPDTLGQFTGLHDKHGKEIYEGDIVLQRGYGRIKPMVVRFEQGAFIVGWHNGSSTATRPMLIQKRGEIIGNIHDNPELLKGGEE